MVYLGLGSNLGEPLKQLQQAIAELQQLTNTTVDAVSSFYASKPMGPQDQPDYVNAVVKVNTALTPEQLLQQTQQIERKLGRVRDSQRWGPRLIDIDILLWADEVIESRTLTIPHYGLTDRSFVVFPLLEIAPNIVMPGGQPLQQVAQRLSDSDIRRLDSGNAQWQSQAKSV